MDKKYNGFNNGRDRSDGVGGREVNHGKQETMTKEQAFIKQQGYHKNVTVILSDVECLLKEYAQQQLSAERERLEGFIKNEPVSFFLVNIMRNLPNEKWPDLINALNERCSLPTAERERGQQFPTTEQMDAAINVSIGKMFGGLEAASIDHFLQTGKINGSFRQRLHDCIKSASMLVDIKAKTQLLKERERAGKLVEALREVLVFHLLPKTIHFDSQYIQHEYNQLFRTIKQTLNEYDTATKES